MASSIATAIMLPMFATNVFAAGNPIEINETNFPDGAWRNAVTFNDTDHDGYLSASEIAAVTNINVYGRDIESFEGIKHFTNLKSLFAGHNNLTTLDVSGMTNLEYIEFQGSYLEKLDISGCTSLVEYHGDTGSVIANGCTSIKEINTYYAEVEGCTALETLSAHYYGEIDLDLSSCTSLVNVDLSIYNGYGAENDRGGLKTLNVSGLSHLERLSCQNNILESINLTGCTSLNFLDCSNNHLTSLDLRDCNNLNKSYFDYSDNNIQTFTVSENFPLRVCFVYMSGTDAYEVSSGTVTEIEADMQSAVSSEYTMTDVFNSLYTGENYSIKVIVVGRTTANATPTPTVVVEATPNGVSSFVERLYTIALERASDPNGKADWVNRVYTAGATGADIAQGFLFSPEFLNKNMSNSDFLAVLYRVFFDRPGDQGGIDYWLGQMAGGMDKQTVIWGFINSTEWANVCLRYGISSGGNGVPNISVEPSNEVIEFATRLYTTCLGRNADQAGLMDWARQLANRQISGSQAAAGFFTSGEFVSANYDNTEYINRLYRTFMGREADQGGFDYWMGQFAQGASREDVFNGFAGSQEWAGICSSYGILK